MHAPMIRLCKLFECVKTNYEVVNAHGGILITYVTDVLLLQNVPANKFVLLG